MDRIMRDKGLRNLKYFSLYLFLSAGAASSYLCGLNQELRDIRDESGYVSSESFERLERYNRKNQTFCTGLMIGGVVMAMGAEAIRDRKI